LDKLTLDKDSGTWQSVRAALETIWDKEKIDVLSTQLQTLRQELALRVLVLLNAKNDAQASCQSERFDRLDRNTQDIVEVVSINQSMLKSALADHATEARRQGDQSDFVAKHRHEEVIAAILTLRDGNTQTLARPAGLDIPNGDGTSGKVAQTSMTIREGTHPAYSASDAWGPEEREDYIVRGPLPATITLGDYSPIPRKVLDCIYFRQITERMDEVAIAHGETFQWLYRDPLSGQKPWDNFPRWLEEGGGCYWISGKAGSGKSTLMKFIERHEKTQQCLQAWAGNRQLITTSFFFWNNGTAIQKSQSGLLRSLLFNILDKHKYLIPSVLSNLCRAAVAERSQSLSEPSLAELKNAFESLVTQKVASLNICLFIDGLDEYDGDHNELCNLFTQIAASPYIKIVLSSRPIPACVEAFSHCAKLRLQDLTYDDIQLYVETKLSGHPNIHKLEALEGPATTELVTEITKKASGVFLWVMLVVKSLLQGLQNFDHIADLQRRVDMLPADLENLYRQMFQSMSPIYKEQASQLLQLVLRSADVQTQGQLSLLQLSYAEEEDLQRAVRAPLRVLSSAEKDLRCEAVEGRLRSRCCGLVEVQERTQQERFLSSTPTYVWFLHKTVGDFLRTESVWREIVSFTAKMSFDVDTMLLSSCLHEAKVLPIETELILEMDRVFIDVHHSLAYSTHIETTERRPCHAYLNELEKVASRHWAPVKKFKFLATDETWQDKDENQWAVLLAKQRYNWQRWQTPTNSFVALTALYGSVLYAAERALKDTFLGTREQTYLLAQLIVQYFSTGNAKFSNYFSAISSLLNRRADPNLVIDLWPSLREDKLVWASAVTQSSYRTAFTDRCTPWEYCLSLALCMVEAEYNIFEMRYALEAFTAFLQILEELLHAGANVNAVRPCIKGNPSNPSNYAVVSAMWIIYRLLPPETLHSQKVPLNISDDMVFIKLTHARIVKFMTEKGASFPEVGSPTSNSSPTLRRVLERNRSSHSSTLVASPMQSTPGGSFWSSTSMSQQNSTPKLASPGSLRRKWSKFVGGLMT
jgi:hypothetical protein